MYELRAAYYLNKFNNDLEKNMSINIHSIDSEINQLQDKIKYQKASGMFTSQNEFVKLLTLLTQLLTKTNSKKFKNDINQLLKNLCNSRQITKQVYNILNEVVTYKNDS